MPRRGLLAAAMLCLCICFAPADRAAAGGDGYPTGWLAIGVHPIGGTGPVCFTLTDPLGRRMSTGPPCEAVELSEIPYAYQDYESIGDDETGGTGPVTRVIYIAGPEEGDYILELSLPDDEAYDLEVQGSDPEGGTSHRLLSGIKSDPAVVRTFVIGYSGFPAAEVHVEERLD